MASIEAAKIPAFFAPLIATVATGIPVGIITVARSASIPSSCADLQGIPITGSIVFAARTPARCAAMPAAAIITPNPFFTALAENSIAASGVRCALITWTSYSTPNSCNFLTAFDTTGKSLSEPIIIATFFIIFSLYIVLRYIS